MNVKEDGSKLHKSFKNQWYWQRLKKGNWVWQCPNFHPILAVPSCFAPAWAAALQLHPAAWPLVPFLGKASGKQSCQKVTFCLQGPFLSANIQSRDVSSDIWKNKCSKNTFSPKFSAASESEITETVLWSWLPSLFWIWLSKCSFEQTVVTFKRPQAPLFLLAFIHMCGYGVHAYTCTSVLHGPIWLFGTLILYLRQRTEAFAVPQMCPEHQDGWFRPLPAAAIPTGWQQWGRGLCLVLLEVLWSASGSCCDGKNLIEGSSHSFTLPHCSEWANTTVLVLPLPLRSPAAASLTINGLLINAVKG